MSFELYPLFLIGLGYLLLLFGIAHVADRGLIPERLIHHPVTYVLSLGVLTGAWAIYGVVGLAQEYGYGFLSIYLGVAGSFIFAPLLLMPIMRITRTYLHSSLADVLSFRYRSQWAGSLITLFSLLAVWPLLAMQIQAVADSLHLLTSNKLALPPNQSRHNALAFFYCVAICLFTISFGSKHLTAHERNNGLVAAIAFESLVKVVAFLAVGGVAIYQVFGGFSGLEQWLTENPQLISTFNHPMRADSSRALLLIFFSATVAMPHLFHMIFCESPKTKSLSTASWGMPLLLMLMSLPVLPILWAGLKLNTLYPAEYFTLAIGLELESRLLSILVYLGGLSAASGAVIVITLALASMCLKHLVLPLYTPGSNRDIYRWMIWIRRLLIALIILTGYLFYRFMDGREALSSLGLVAFIATLQFLPGVLAAFYWQGANRKGFIAGLGTGFALWFISLLLPMFSTFDTTFVGKLYFNLSYSDLWTAATIVSLGFNMLVFGVVSLLTNTSDEERNAAVACAIDDLSKPIRRPLNVSSPAQMREQLSTVLGARTAQREVNRALDQMKLPSDESRPLALRQLRHRLEANLSGLLGPSVANNIVNKLLPYGSDTNQGEDINLIEVQLENYKLHLTGLAADLDNLRRYHRQTLQNLPVGVCSLGKDNEILMWNHAFARLTGIESDAVIGSSLHTLSKPWGQLLSDFLELPQPHLYKQQVKVDGSNNWFNLHKTTANSTGEPNDGHVIVLEDISEIQLLEEELLHSERLASIGRLAAGVAHEIGNPITGIACLAQNLRYDTDNPASLEAANEILAQTDRVSKIVQTLVSFAHSGSEGSHKKLQPVQIKACVDEAIHLLYLNKEAKQVQFDNICLEDQYALADNQRLLQVFINLLSNARDASPTYGAITISCQVISPLIFISVTDRGSGISKTVQEQIFEPFFTTKEAGEGTGLGLSLAYSIIEDFGGQISVESPADDIYGGTRFTLRLKHYSQKP